MKKEKIIVIGHHPSEKLSALRFINNEPELVLAGPVFETPPLVITNPYNMIYNTLPDTTTKAEREKDIERRKLRERYKKAAESYLKAKKKRKKKNKKTNKKKK